MKTRTPATKYFLATAAAGFLAINALTGCFDSSSPSSNDGNGNMNATLEGRVQGDMALAKRASGSVGIEGATVTVMRIKSDGSLEAVAGAEVKTDVQGHFSIQAAVDSVRELVIVAKKDAKEWKGVVSAKAGQGSHIVCRPLNTESSVEADVLIKTRSQSKSITVSFADIASHIDAEMAVKADAKADTKAAVEAYLAAQLQTEAETRTSVLLASSGKFTLAQLDKADEARMDAEAKFEADLDAAFQGSASADAQAQVKAGADFEQAEFKAFADAGIALGEVAKAQEACFQAMVESGSKLTIGTDASVEADAKKTWLHKIAIHEASTLEAAVNADVKASGGQSEISTEAGAALKASLNTAKDKAECDSAFAKFRSSVSTSVKSMVETTLGAKVLLSDSSKARLELKASLALAAASGSADKVAEAYKKFYADAETEIKGNITATLGTAASDTAKVEALTRAVLLIGIQGDGGKGGIQIGTGGFSLSGQVEGNVSGADVQVAKVKADGSLEIITGFSGKTDAQGGFTLNSETKIPDSIVVVITKNDAKLLTFVDSATAKPVQVGSETTVETQVYQQTVKDGKTGITIDQIKSQVDSSVAAGVKGDDSAMVHLIAGLETSYRTQDKFLMDSGFSLSASGLASIATARASAEAKLEADIKAAAGTETSIHAAYEAYNQALLDAYVKAGLDASAFARSQQVYAQALAHFSADLSAQAKLTLVRSAHAGAARGLRTATEAKLKASGATEATLKSMTDAGLALQASVESAVSVEAIATAYEAYHASAVASLKTAFLLQAGTIETLDTKIHGQDGARAEFLAKVKNAADADAVAKAHVDFAAQVETQVKAAFGSGLGAPSSAQIKTMTDVMVLANMGG